MIYVMDTNALSVLLRNMYQSVFHGLWVQFDQLVVANRITSTREVMRELNDWNVAQVQAWVTSRCSLFPAPSVAEAEFVAQMFSVSKFQELIEYKKLLRSSKHADAFVIARAFVLSATVVTQERPTGNAKMPDICDYFEIRCCTLEALMQQENWTF